MREINVALTDKGRCPLCNTSYASFRAGLSTAAASAMLTADVRADDGSATYAVASDLRSEATDRATRNAGAGMKLAGQIKRAAWDEAHGPGRCFPDVWTPIIDRVRARGFLTADDRAWALAELQADLLLDDEEDAADDESIDVDVSFDADAFAVPVWIDDGQATTCIAS